MDLAELIIGCITLVAIVAIVFGQGHIAENAIRGMIEAIKIFGRLAFFKNEGVKRLNRKSEPNKLVDD